MLPLVPLAPTTVVEGALATSGICVVGPSANQTQAQMGDCHPAGAGRGVLTPWVGTREAAEAAYSTATLVPVPGCAGAYCESVGRKALQQGLEQAGVGKPFIVVVGTSAWSHVPNATNTCGLPRAGMLSKACAAIGTPSPCLDSRARLSSWLSERPRQPSRGLGRSNPVAPVVFVGYDDRCLRACAMGGPGVRYFARAVPGADCRPCCGSFAWQQGAILREGSAHLV